MSLTGCMVGPNFHTPRSPHVSSYTATKMPAKTVRIAAAGKGGKSQRFIPAADIPAAWWYLFRSPEINELVRVGIANSPTIGAAKANLMQAKEILLAQVGSTLFPQVDAQFNGTRQRFAGATVGAGSSSIFNIFNTSVNVTYALDIWGGARRGIEALWAQADNQEFQLIATYLTLTTNIVTTAITVASLQAQIEATIDLIKAEEDQLVILNKQFRLGGISRATVYTQETLVAQTKATLPLLQNSLAKSQHALAVLVGAFPNARLPKIRLEKLDLPTNIPVSLPACLVRQRPDVRASEALLHAATAQIGVATANLFPQLTLTGNYGYTATVLSSLFDPNNKVWSIGAGLVQPVFHGGALLAQRRAAVAAYQSACFQYRQTVLLAFQNVADSLRALETDARALQAEQEAEIASRSALKLVQEQYFLGGTSYVALLIAQQQYQQARINRIRAEALRFTDTAALFQSLGGGWWHCSDFVCINQKVDTGRPIFKNSGKVLKRI